MPVELVQLVSASALRDTSTTKRSGTFVPNTVSEAKILDLHTPKRYDELSILYCTWDPFSSPDRTQGISLSCTKYSMVVNTAPNIHGSRGKQNG